MTDPAWRRWTLLAALFALGCGYLFAYAFYRFESFDFISAQRNARAIEYSRSHPIHLPAILRVDEASPDTQRLGGGWHPPEKAGRWSFTDDVWIELYVAPPHDRNLKLTFNATAFVARSHPRVSIAAEANDGKLGTWKRDTSDASTPMQAHIPATLIRNGMIQLHLRIRHGGVPFRLRAGDDTRRLGLLLHSIELDYDGAPL